MAEESSTVIYNSPLADLQREGTSVFSNGGKAIYFPSDLDKMGHWVTFRAIKFEKINGRNRSDKSLLTTISLPMPASLDTGYNAGYENASGLIPTLAAEASGTVLNGISKMVKSIASHSPAVGPGEPPVPPTSLSDAIKNLIANQNIDDITKSIGAGVTNVATLAASEAIRRGGTNVQAAVAGVGIAANPFNVLLYHGPKMRDHSFSYRLSARGKKDTNAIRDIIWAFKYHMSGRYGIGKAKDILPTASGDISARAFLEYPEYFEINFHYEKYLFRIGPSVLSNFTVSYHPENYPAYVRSLKNPGDEPAPLEVAIRMDFQERDIVTKDNIESDWS